jgi:hypothetical protein
MKIVNRGFDSGDLNRAVPKRCHLRAWVLVDVILTCIDDAVLLQNALRAIGLEPQSQETCGSNSIATAEHYQSHFSTAHCGRLIKLMAGPIADRPHFVCAERGLLQIGITILFVFAAMFCVGNAVIWPTLIVFDICNQSRNVLSVNVMQKIFEVLILNGFHQNIESLQNTEAIF